MIQVTGALQTTPNNLMDAHMGLLPMDIRIKQVCMMAAARIAMLPKLHPLHELARRAANFIK
ncbi:hypothetical protein J132_06972 [Termitomyces sp. J132]|nr:hypothetical protein J132_06963 [Termitomyces sp. J132]KNZ77094.1 hypothetical protein J132_06972 [Termitomyces sp. J132]